MSYRVCLLVLSISPLLPLTTTAAGDASVTVPWSEFQLLYQQQIEARLKESLLPERKTAIHTIESVRYLLHVDEYAAAGSLEIQGRVLQGEVEPFPLFDEKIAVTGVMQADGAHVLVRGNTYEVYAEGPGEFRLDLGISIPLQARDGGLELSFQPPGAVSNSLQLTITDNLWMADSGSLQTADGLHYFSSVQPLSLRFERKLVSMEAADAIQIDGFTRLSLRGDNLVAENHFLPRKSIKAPVTLSIPPTADSISTSLPRSWVNRTDEKTLVIELPEKWQAPFTVQYALDARSDRVDMPLPRFDHNDGREGEFSIDLSAEARISAKGDSIRRDLAVESLSEEMRTYATQSRPFMRVPAAQSLLLEIQRFDIVRAPEVVLDSVYLYSSFTDEGNILTAIRLSLPPQSGERLLLQAVPDAEIWSVRVNGKIVNLYTQGADNWVVPLAGDAESQVELAFLRRGQKLGLEGSLALLFPKTGLTAQSVNVVIGLSERVDLIAMDSDLHPTEAVNWPTSTGFRGKPYYFTRSYYRGDAIKVEIYYKEPTNNDAREES